MAIPLTQMQQDVSGLISDWGVACKVSRLVGTRNSSGRFSGTWVSQTTETAWVQPATTREMRIDPGIEEKDEYMMFQHKSGFALNADDRVSPLGDSYLYDVIGVSVRETHIETQLKRVKRA